MNNSRVPQKVLFFSRWTRKKYAIFNSLHRLISISCIALACSFLGKPTEGVAQTHGDTIKETLDEVNVTAEAPPETENMEPLMLQHVMVQREISRSAVHSVNELLEYLPGVDIRQRGPMGTQADISYRGGNFDQTLVLLNGINFSDPQTGHYTLNLPIAPDLIRKVELYKNSSSFLFGSSAFSGVINMITSPDTSFNVGLHLMGGMYGLYRIQTQLHWQTEKFRHLLATDYHHSDGYVENTDFNIIGGYYQTIGSFKSGTLEFQVGYNQKKYGANGFYSLKFPNQYEETETFLTSVKWKNNGIVKVIPAFYFRLNEDRFQLTKWKNPNKNNLHLNHIAGLNLLSYFNSPLGKSSFVADVRLEGIVSSSLGTLLPEPIQVGSTSNFYKYGANRTLIALSAAQRYSYKGFTAQGTLLLQHLSTLPERFFFLPAALVSYEWKASMAPKIEVMVQHSLLASKTIRYPTFTDLYYHTGDVSGNVSLLPEEAYTYEVGTTFQWKRIDFTTPFLVVEIALFHRQGKNLIDYIKKEDESIWQAVNHTQTNFTGLDLLIRLDPSGIFKKKCFFNYLVAQYNYLYSDKNSEGYQSRYLLDHLTHQLSVTMDMEIYNNLSVNCHFSYGKRKGEYRSFERSPLGENKEYPDLNLLNVRLQYQLLKQYTFYIEASNLLNQKYFDIGGIDQPGIWVIGGIRYSFKKKESN